MALLDNNSKGKVLIAIGQLMVIYNYTVEEATSAENRQALIARIMFNGVDEVDAEVLAEVPVSTLVEV